MIRRQLPEQQTNMQIGRDVLSLIAVGLKGDQPAKHMLIDATTGGGKTVTQIIPYVLREVGNRPFLVTSTKLDVWETTAGHVSSQQQAWHLNFLDPGESHGYDPLEAITTYEQALLFAESWISNTGRDETQGVGAYFDDEAERLLSMLAWHLRVAEPDATFERLIQYAYLTYEEQRDLLYGSPDPVIVRSAQKAFSSWDLDPRLKGAISNDVARRFKFYLDAPIRRIMSRRDIHLHEMTSPQKPTALYLTVEPSQARLYRALIATLITQMIDSWTRVARKSPGHRLPYGGMLYLDEFAQLGYLPGLVGYQTTIRSTGIGMVIVVQSLSQLSELYGEAKAKSIRDNCRTQLVLSGAAQEDCEYFSRKAGDATIWQETDTWVVGANGELRQHTTRTPIKRPAIKPDEIMTMRRDWALLFTECRHGMLIQTQPYDEHPVLSRLAEILPPEIEGPPEPPPFVLPDVPKPKPRRKPTQKEPDTGGSVPPE